MPALSLRKCRLSSRDYFAGLYPSEVRKPGLLLRPHANREKSPSQISATLSAGARAIGYVWRARSQSTQPDARAFQKRSLSLVIRADKEIKAELELEGQTFEAAKILPAPRAIAS